jgi:hypothetical protein
VVQVLGFPGKRWQKTKAGCIIPNMNEKQTDQIAEATDKPAVTPSTTTVRPTKKQKEILGFIEAFITEHGYSPSYREIMNGLQYTSVATVALHVGNLIKRGHLRKRDHSARSIEVVSSSGQPAEALSLKTNGVKVGQEKWLVEKVEQFFADAEALPMPEAGHIDNLYVLLGALRVLGMDGAAQSFMERLSALKSKQAESTTVG